MTRPPSDLPGWLNTYAEPLDASHWVAQLRKATWGKTWGSQLDWCDVQRDKVGEQAHIDVPPRCLVMCGFEGEFEEFDIQDALIRDEYWTILDRIVAFAREVDDVPSSDVEMQDVETTERGPRLQDHNRLKSFKAITGKLAIIVTGSPGNGKSIFLHLLLRLCSNATRPTLLQIEPNEAFLVTEYGAHILGEATLEKSQPARWLRKFVPSMWCLTDSDDDIPRPSLFVRKTACTIVQTPSPRTGRMEWIKKVSSRKRMFCMAPFTLQDAIIARQFQLRRTPNERQLEYWYERYTPSFRPVCDYGLTPHNYELMMKQELMKVDATALGALGRGVARNALDRDSPNTPHEIFIHFPLEDRDFASTKVRIATPHLAAMILDRFQAIDAAKRLELFRLWRDIEPLAAATGRLLEGLAKGALPNGGVHPLKVLQADDKIRYTHYTVASGSPSALGAPDAPDCYLVIDGSVSPSVSINHRNPGNENFTAVPVKYYNNLESDVLADDAFYFPLSPSEPTFDFIHVQGHQAVLFQCTVASSHDVKQKGLEKLDGLAQKLGIERKDMIYIGVVPKGQGSTKFVIDKQVASRFEFKSFKGHYLLPYEPGN